MGLIRDSLVDAGNKSTAGSSNLLRGTMKSLFDAKLYQMVRSTNLYFNLHRFLKNRGSWVIVVS
jgi:hypothetical protein